MLEPQNDPARPTLVYARRHGVLGPGYALLSAHHPTLEKWLTMGSMAKLGEYMGLVHGRFPDGDYPPGTTGLLQPVAIFRGLKRPLNAGFGQVDSSIVTYVTNPGANYRYIRGREGDTVRQVPVPDNSVFTTFVSFHPQMLDAALQSVHQDASEPIQGVVLHWEWTEASPTNSRLPIDYNARYEEPLL